jgi:predicted RNA methylase
MKNENIRYIITMSQPIDPDVLKYFFPEHKCINNVQMSKESLYSSTPATHADALGLLISTLYSDAMILEASAHVGADTINLLKHGFTVIAVEKNETYFNMLRNNISIYFESPKITYYNCSVTDIKQEDIQNVKVGYFDPPWGGSSYKRKNKIRLYYGDVEIADFIQTLQLETNIIKLPKNYDFSRLKLEGYTTNKYPVKVRASKSGATWVSYYYAIVYKSSLKFEDRIKKHMNTVQIHEHKKFTNLHKISGGTVVTKSAPTTFSALTDTIFFNTVLSDGKQFISKDRNEHIVICKDILSQLVNENDILVSDIKKITDPSSEIEVGRDGLLLYSKKPYLWTLNMANVLHAKGYILIKMKTVIPNEKLVLEYDSRHVATVFLLKQHHKITCKSLISPVQIDKINFLPHESEIIKIYRMMYSPTQYDNWPQLIELEKLVMSHIEDRVNKKIIGGKNDCDDCNVVRKVNVKYLRKMLLKFISDKYVLVGHCAVSITNTDNDCFGEKLQIITHEEVEATIHKIIDVLKNYTDRKLAFKKQKLYLLDDFRSSRYTIYVCYSIGNKTVEKPIMDIFNSGQFELIPYANATYQNTKYMIGNPYVLLRFLMIDMWIIRIICKLGLIQQQQLFQKIKKIMKHVKMIRSGKWINEKFGLQYIGNYQDPSVAQKIKNMQTGMCYPYYPEKFKNEMKKYKTV